MTNNTFDQAQHDAWAQDAESPAEQEEREAVQAGNPWPLRTDAEQTEVDDSIVADMVEAEREWLFGHGPRPEWTLHMPAEAWYRHHAE